MPEQTKPKQKYKVYTFKLFNIMLTFRRKIDKNYKPTAPRKAVVQGERYQAMYFGYEPLGAKRFFLSARSIAKYMEQKYNEQSPENRQQFARYMQRSKRIREKMLSKAVGK